MDGPNYNVVVDEEQDFLDECNMRRFYQEFCFGDFECHIDSDVDYESSLDLGLQTAEQETCPPTTQQHNIERLYIPLKRKGKKRPGRKKNKSKKVENAPEMNEELTENLAETSQDDVAEEGFYENMLVTPEDEDSGLPDDRPSTVYNESNVNVQITENCIQKPSDPAAQTNTHDANPATSQTAPNMQSQNDKKSMTRGKSQHQGILKNIPEIRIDESKQCYDGYKSKRKARSPDFVKDKKHKQEDRQKHGLANVKHASGDSGMDDTDGLDLMMGLFQACRISDNQTQNPAAIQEVEAAAKKLLHEHLTQEKSSDHKTARNNCHTKHVHSSKTPFQTYCGAVFSKKPETPVFAAPKEPEKKKSTSQEPILQKASENTGKQTSQRTTSTSQPKQPLTPNPSRSKQKILPITTTAKRNIQSADASKPNTNTPTQPKEPETNKSMLSDAKKDGILHHEFRKSLIKNQGSKGESTLLTPDKNKKSPEHFTTDKCKQKKQLTADEELQQSRAKQFRANTTKESNVQEKRNENCSKYQTNTTLLEKLNFSSEKNTDDENHEKETKTGAKTSVKETKVVSTKNVALQNILRRATCINKETDGNDCSKHTPADSKAQTPQRVPVKPNPLQKTMEDKVKSVSEKSKASKIPVRENQSRTGHHSPISSTTKGKVMNQQSPITETGGLGEKLDKVSSKSRKHNEEARTGFWKRVGDFFKAKR